MPVEISWLLEGRVINVKYSGDVTLEDKRDGAELEYEYLEAGTAPLVHVLLDITDQTSAPTNIKAIQDALDKALSHPAKGWTIAFGKEEFKMENFVNSVVTQPYSVRYRTFATRAEALEFLTYMDSTLAEFLNTGSES